MGALTNVFLWETSCCGTKTLNAANKNVCQGNPFENASKKDGRTFVEIGAKEFKLMRYLLPWGLVSVYAA